MQEVVAGLSRDDGILNIGNNSNQLLRPDAADLSVIMKSRYKGLAMAVLRLVDV